MIHARQNLIYTANVPLVLIKQMSSIKCKIRALGSFQKRYKCAVLLSGGGLQTRVHHSWSLQLTRDTREMRVLRVWSSATVLQCCSAALCMIWSRQMFLVDQSHTCLAVTCHVSRVTCLLHLTLPPLGRQGRWTQVCLLVQSLAIHPHWSLRLEEP